MSDRCACGTSLRFSDPIVEARVRRAVARFGSTVRVPTDAGIYHVPRQYIALHGLKMADVPRLARRYGWTKSRVA